MEKIVLSKLRMIGSLRVSSVTNSKLYRHESLKQIMTADKERMDSPVERARVSILTGEMAIRTLG